MQIMEIEQSDSSDRSSDLSNIDELLHTTFNKLIDLYDEPKIREYNENMTSITMNFYAKVFSVVQNKVMNKTQVKKFIRSELIYLHWMKWLNDITIRRKIPALKSRSTLFQKISG